MNGKNFTATANNCKARERWIAALRDCPPPGTGRAHSWCMATANVAPREGLDVQEAEAGMLDAFNDPARARRHLRDVRTALEKAFRDFGQAASFGRVQLKRPTVDRRKAGNALRDYVKAGADFGEADLWEASPVRIDWPPGWEDAVAFVHALFRAEDWVFLGYSRRSPGIVGWTVRLRDDWLRELEQRGRAGKLLPMLVLPNPVSPVPAPKQKSEGTTLRGDESVCAWRHLVLEHDKLPLDGQLAFLFGFGAKHGWNRIKSAVLTGGKSIHVLLEVIGCNSREDWKEIVENGWFAQVFGPMDFDNACKNPGRLTRLPGVQRRPDDQKEIGKTFGLQRLLYLKP